MALRSLTFDDDVVASRLKRFPGSRYMGSKHAILPFLESVFAQLSFNTALDAFSGSSSVAYLLKAMGKSVTANDFLRMGFHTANAVTANDHKQLQVAEVRALLTDNGASAPDFVQRTFEGMYFTQEDNAFLDRAVYALSFLEDSQKQSIGFAALARACIKRRPRGVFTYTGLRYMDGRRDVRISIEDHFFESIHILNGAVFPGTQPCSATNVDVFDLNGATEFDLVYFDPPYVSMHSDNDYTRRYHFIEGLLRYWQGLEIQNETSTKKFRRLPSRFDSKKTISEAFSDLFARYRDSIIVVSYSSNSIPSRDEMIDLLGSYKSSVEVFEQEHRYSFGTHAQRVGNNQNLAREFLFVGR